MPTETTDRLPELAALDPRDPNFAIEVVDTLIPLAIERAASDVHIQPMTGGWKILFRIDGVLSVDQTLRGGGDSDPVSRLMVLANLPTYRASQPMEGRIAWANGHAAVPSNAASNGGTSIRLGIFPTVHGPRAVIRLLRTDDSHDSLASLGLPDDVTDSLEVICDQTDGAVLLSGPTGSGKTTTMYAMLRRIAGQSPRRSVMTIEDPVESLIPAISQSELDLSGGLTLASAMRSAVRQDTEVLLVSEIRDPETAEAAVQASLTGHLVFSSLHATDVPASLRRLVQLGVPEYVIRSGVRAIVTQRLLRRRCDDHAAKDSAGRMCPHCLGTGYRGRIAIASLVRLDGSDPVGEALADALAMGQSAGQMRVVARRAGAIDLHARAAELVASGQTDAPEVYRVLGSPHSF